MKKKGKRAQAQRANRGNRDKPAEPKTPAMVPTIEVPSPPNNAGEQWEMLRRRVEHEEEGKWDCSFRISFIPKQVRTGKRQIPEGRTPCAFSNFVLATKNKVLHFVSREGYT